MTDIQVINNFLDDPDRLLALALGAKRLGTFDRYDNPFERKWTMRKEIFYQTDVFYQTVYQYLMHPKSLWWVQRLLQCPSISHADWTHYGGVFVYDKGDYLMPHVDAGLHPTKNLRKIATACIYLTPATLVFWHGEPAHYSKPTVSYVDKFLEISANSLVLFINTDDSWHSVPIIDDDNPRVVVTCSYLAFQEFKDPNYTNYRTRAYFARHDEEPFDEKLEQLRELRASERAAEVYRI